MGRRHFLTLAGTAGAGLAFSACRQASDLWRGESGQVVRVRDGDLLVLDSGLQVRLAEIEAPSLKRRKGPADPYATTSKKILETYALGRQCHLHYGGLTRDRYGRALAHAMIEDELGRHDWLNARLVSFGAARVRTWPDNCTRVRPLLKLESEARLHKLGLWALPAYRPLQPVDLAMAEPGHFVLLEGHVTRMADSDQSYGLCEADTDNGLFMLLGSRLHRQSQSGPLSLRQFVRVRGSVRRDSLRRSVRLTHWAQIELL